MYAFAVFACPVSISTFSTMSWISSIVGAGKARRVAGAVLLFQEHRHDVGEFVGHLPVLAAHRLRRLENRVGDLLLIKWNELPRTLANLPDDVDAHYDIPLCMI